jgi:quercetin dioxygenase-like cupin family protein
MRAQPLAERHPEQQASTRETVRRPLLENDQVLVIETTYPVKGSVPMHSHRFPQVLYVIEGGTVEATAVDGTVEVLEIRAGQTAWRPAQAHSTRNVGSTRVKIVEVEVKNASGAAGVVDEKPIVVAPADISWTPDSLDPSRASALLIGDPQRPGPFTVRYRVPAGYTLGLHLHPDEGEHLTVLSGTLYWSSGEAGSGAPVYTVPAGGVALIPAGMPHRLWTTEATTVQLSGVGPRSYRYLDPAEDPRARG